MVRLPPKLGNELIDSYRVAAARLKHIGDYDQEHLVILTVNGDNLVIGEHIIAIGDEESSVISLAILFNRVIQDKAKGFFVGHNHPNGVRSFSHEDYILASRCYCFARIIRVACIDFFLFPYCRDGISMKQASPKKWEKITVGVSNRIDEEIISVTG
jgi:DNA repair protein RadC